MGKELLTIRESAGILGVAEATLRDWQAQNRLPFYRMGRSIRFKREDLIRFREDSRVEVAK